MDPFLQITELTKKVEEIGRNFLNEYFKNSDNSGVMAKSAAGTIACLYLYDWVYHNDIAAGARIKTGIFDFVKSLPYLKEKIRVEIEKEKKELQKSLQNNGATSWVTEMPLEGMSTESLVKLMQEYVDYDTVDWEAGKISGTTFTNDPDVSKVCSYIFNEFGYTNPLHPDIFKSLRKMEAEILAMCLHLYNAPPKACGLLTAGGSESLGIAVLAARNTAMARGVKWPEVLMCRTAHCGIDKACHYFRCKLVKVNEDPITFTAPIDKMRKMINKNTCLIVGSAPDYPHGLMDDLRGLSNLAVEYNLPMHVDACMGGFLLPFAKDAGFPLAPFDFRLPGVTSISADIHKYGCCPKGASALLFRDPELRRSSFFCEVNWPGGLYVTPTYAGSRPGSAVATAWGVMNKLGKKGYVENARQIISACRKLREAIKSMSGLYVMGQPQLCICAFTSDDFDIYALLTEMRGRGWTIGAMQFPPALHLDVTNLTTKKGVIELFIKDLSESAVMMSKLGSKAAPKGVASVYGKSQGIPDRSIVAELVRCVIETNCTAPRKDQLE